MAHVYGHATSSRTTSGSRKTNRKMIDEMANHAVARAHATWSATARTTVEDFIDALPVAREPDRSDVAVHPARASAPRRRRGRRGRRRATSAAAAGPRTTWTRSSTRPSSSRQQKKKTRGEKQKKKQQFPEQPQRDVLLFLLEHAPLERWQRDVLEIIRDEAYYFAPQAQTKIMNEGWACVDSESLRIFTSSGNCCRWDDAGRAQRRVCLRR